jgi:hypothetical protein
MTEANIALANSELSWLRGKGWVRWWRSLKQVEATLQVAPNTWQQGWVRRKGSKLGEGGKEVSLVEATLQVSPNSGVQESAYISALRAGRENMLADLESPRNYVH